MAKAGARYQVVVGTAAAKSLASLPATVRRRIGTAIDGLAAEPRPNGVKKLQGGDDLYRIRVGDYRVVYEIRDRRLLVLIVRIGHRRDIYEGGK
jgi:mRNA interferase RelE/StbE